MHLATISMQEVVFRLRLDGSIDANTEPITSIMPSTPLMLIVSLYQIPTNRSAEHQVGSSLLVATATLVSQFSLALLRCELLEKRSEYEPVFNRNLIASHFLSEFRSKF